MHVRTYVRSTPMDHVMDQLSGLFFKSADNPMVRAGTRSSLNYCPAPTHASLQPPCTGSHSDFRAPPPHKTVNNGTVSRAWSLPSVLTVFLVG